MKRISKKAIAIAVSFAMILTCFAGVTAVSFAADDNAAAVTVKVTYTNNADPEDTHDVILKTYSSEDLVKMVSDTPFYPYYFTSGKQGKVVAAARGARVADFILGLIDVNDITGLKTASLNNDSPFTPKNDQKDYLTQGKTFINTTDEGVVEDGAVEVPFMIATEWYTAANAFDTEHATVKAIFDAILDKSIESTEGSGLRTMAGSIDAEDTAGNKFVGGVDTIVAEDGFDYTVKAGSSTFYVENGETFDLPATNPWLLGEKEFAAGATVDVDAVKDAAKDGVITFTVDGRDAFTVSVNTYKKNDDPSAEGVVPVTETKAIYSDEEFKALGQDYTKANYTFNNKTMLKVDHGVPLKSVLEDNDINIDSILDIHATDWYKGAPEVYGKAEYLGYVKTPGYFFPKATKVAAVSDDAYEVDALIATTYGDHNMVSDADTATYEEIVTGIETSEKYASNSSSDYRMMVGGTIEEDGTVKVPEGKPFCSGVSGLIVDKTLGAEDIKVSLKTTKYTYSGSEKKPAVTVTAGKTTLEQAKDYTVEYKNNKNAGKASAVVTGIAFDGEKTASFTIAKAKNPLSVSKTKVTKSYKVKSLKKKAKTFTAVTVKKKEGKVTYTAKAANSKSKKALKFKKGKITVKKGTKKGTYKMTVTVKAAGNSNYNAGTKKVTVTVKVKK